MQQHNTLTNVYFVNVLLYLYVFIFYNFQIQNLNVCAKFTVFFKKKNPLTLKFMFNYIF